MTGSRPKAESGTLTIMAGGQAEAYERALPLFEAMGELVLHVGPQGHGSMVKLINNTLAAVNAAALAEGLVVARAAGVDTDKLLEVLAAGSGDSAMRELKAEPMLQGDFEPLFKLDHMRKDLNHFLAEAARLGGPRRWPSKAEEAYRRSPATLARRNGLRGCHSAFCHEIRLEIAGSVRNNVALVPPQY